MRLLIVGARETRVYEAQYLQRLQKAIAGDPRIQLFDVTDDVDEFFRQADCLVLTSLNEVTPMVISEVGAQSHILFLHNFSHTPSQPPPLTPTHSPLPRRRCRGVCPSLAPTSQVRPHKIALGVCNIIDHVLHVCI